MANCEVEIGMVGQEKGITIKIEGKNEIRVKKHMQTGNVKITDETGSRLDPVVIELSVKVISGNLDVKFPPDEFVMYSQSSPGCGYYYIGGRLVYK